MRTTLTSCFALFVSLLFAQTPDNTGVAEISSNASTQLVVGFNNTSVTARKASITDAQSNFGYQIGVLRKYVLGKHTAFSFGMNVVTTKQQVGFKEKTIAYYDEGIRNYNNLYFRVPLDVTYSPKAHMPLYLSAGFNISSALQNRSTETFLRVTQVDDAGARYEKPVEKTISQYREVSPLDLGIRVGAGMKFNFNKMAFNAGVFYNQGLLNKDMGFRQRQVEFQLGMTLPQIKRAERDVTPTPGDWMN